MRQLTYDEMADTVMQEALSALDRAEQLQMAAHLLRGDTPGRFADEPEDPPRGRPRKGDKQ
jgi:hypothetical protein